MHYLADLQSVHGFRCYDNTARTQNVSEGSVLALMPGYFIKPWFRVKIKVFLKILGLHGTASEMK